MTSPVEQDYRQCVHGYHHPLGPHACDDCLHTKLDDEHPTIFGANVSMTYRLRSEDPFTQKSYSADAKESTLHFATVDEPRTLAVGSIEFFDGHDAHIYGLTTRIGFNAFELKKSLIHHMLHIVRERGVRFVTAEVKPQDKGLWSRLGFQDSATENVMVLELKEA